MKSSEERITELEQKVAHLENILEKSTISNQVDERMEIKNSIKDIVDRRELLINKSVAKESAINKTTIVNPAVDPPKGTENKLIQKEPLQMKPKHEESAQFTQNQYDEQNKQQYRQNFNQNIKNDNKLNNIKNRDAKNGEALIGKYLIGGLAAILIFIGAISFIGLVWNKMTPEIKLSLITLSGLILTVIGFKLVKTHRNPITSIILGTGAGLLFISILSANMAFHLIGNNLTIILAGIWGIFFILSSKYTNLFFMMIIAYIGSYIASLTGLFLMQSDSELLVMVIFATSISGVMIFSTLKNDKWKLVTSILLSYFSYATILMFCYIAGISGSEELLKSYIVQTIIIFILYLIKNMIYKLIRSDNENEIILLFCISIFTTIFTALHINYLYDFYLDVELVTCFSIFLIVNLIQFLLNNIFYKSLDKLMTRYYAVILIIATMLVNTELHNVPTGIILVGLLLVVTEKLFKKESQPVAIGFIILIDAFYMIISPTDNIIFFVYGVIQIVLIGYMLYQCYKIKKYTNIILLKSIGLITIIINSFALPAYITEVLYSLNEDFDAHFLVHYTIAVSAMILLLKSGYFKNWNNDTFKFFGKNSDLEDDKKMQIIQHIVLTLLYFYGILMLIFTDNAVQKLLFTLDLTAVALMQSKIILSSRARNNPVAGIWIGIKYLMLAWSVLGSFSDLDIISVMYSIVGLIIAIGCISAGFKLRAKVIRQYGLGLTLLMVAKFILVDLNQENSITRVLALIAGGILCFLISFIYNKINQNYSE